MKQKTFLSFALLLLAFLAFAQPARQYVTPYAQPDHEDWVYDCGQSATVSIFAVMENHLMPGVEISWSYGPEKLKAEKEGKVTTDKKGMATIKVPGRKEPGFTTVKVSMTYEGRTYTNMTNIGFEPYNIQPTTTLPDDFTEFWDKACESAAKVPMVSKVVWNAEQSTPQIDVYYVKFQSYRPGNFVYGVLSVPKESSMKNAEGKLPAILRLPGATVTGYRGPSELAAHGFAVLEIGIHGIPVDQDREIYSALVSGSLAGYATMGLESRNSFYYKRVFMGCIRAVDFLCSRDEVDASRIAVYGGSQGGMLSIVTAALDKRVAAVVAYFPAFCDVTGYYYGRSGGWPHLFTDRNEPAIQEKIKTSKYYDTVNFARFLDVPGHYCWGFNDIVCCPSSTFSAYNVITAPKELEISRDSGHWLYPVYVDSQIQWLIDRFSVNNN